MNDTDIDEAYRLHAAFVLRRCRRILRDDAAAEDVRQETFLRLWRYGENLRTTAHQLAWLCRVAERCCFDHLARHRGRAETDLGRLGDEPADFRSTCDAEDRELVMQFLGRFDERVKRIAVLHYVGEMTQEEIAQITGCSRQTVFKKIALVRRRAGTFVSTVKAG